MTGDDEHDYYDDDNWRYNVDTKGTMIKGRMEIMMLIMGEKKCEEQQQPHHQEDEERKIDSWDLI